MAVPKILKHKSTYVLLILAAAGAFWFQQNRAKRAQPEYETATVTKQDLAQTVEVTGEIKPADRIELAFDQNGTVESVNVKVGQSVKKGGVLAQLKSDDVGFAVRNAQAALAKAKATLNQRIAGYTKQEIRIAETSLQKAQAASNKSGSDQEAKNKLINQSATLDQNVKNAVATLRIALLASLGPHHTALTDGDAIVGVDDTAANSTYKILLGIYDGTAMPRARASYLLAKPSKIAAEDAVLALTSVSTKEQVLAASDKIQSAALLIQAYLGEVQKVLSTSISGPNLTAAELATKRIGRAHV